MNGYKLIREAYERGLTPAQLYQPYNAIYSAIRGFIDPDYFGVMGWSEDDQKYIPKHVNSDANPLPERDHWGKPCRRTFKKKDGLCHLAGQLG